ncbi:hypothetical protein CDCA_CDCA04G1294 [Cyanidium caldarium]|uniref:GATA-type domain-containing protein n=1 Tax=Cyanidium caldarium TaxID=2771 RepID=A0AAV9ISQ3_CYACA|nr:hypothetical protein CDCA_CDCA04G1294 [Cyanidium caldarium]
MQIESRDEHLRDAVADSLLRLSEKYRDADNNGEMSARPRPLIIPAETASSAMPYGVGTCEPRLHKVSLLSPGIPHAMPEAYRGGRLPRLVWNSAACNGAFETYVADGQVLSSPRKANGGTAELHNAGPSAERAFHPADDGGVRRDRAPALSDVFESGGCPENATDDPKSGVGPPSITDESPVSIPHRTFVRHNPVSNTTASPPRAPNSLPTSHHARLPIAVGNGDRRTRPHRRLANWCVNCGTEQTPYWHRAHADLPGTVETANGLRLASHGDASHSFPSPVRRLCNACWKYTRRHPHRNRPPNLWPRFLGASHLPADSAGMPALGSVAMASLPRWQVPVMPSYLPSMRGMVLLPHDYPRHGSTAPTNNPSSLPLGIRLPPPTSVFPPMRSLLDDSVDVNNLYTLYGFVPRVMSGNMEDGRR